MDVSKGHLGISSVETLYSQIQKVYIKAKKGEEKSRMLRITMEIKSGLTISLGKVLSLQITDDNDCMFFYLLLLTLEDFTVLKSQQGLLVDFDHFPSQLIKLLEACCSQELSKFILVLDEEDSILQSITQKTCKDCVYLKVIETNNFKNLCHLSLKVLQGSDTDIKQHMSLKISNLSDKLSEKEKKCRQLELSLAEALAALEMKSKELTELQMRLTEEKNGLKLETSKQVAEEREKVAKVQMDWQQKMEVEKVHLAKQYQKQLNELNDQISSLTFNNKNLYEGKCHLESCLKEKNFHVESLEKQVVQLTQEVSHLRKQNSHLDQEFHEKDKALIVLKTKLAVVEQELKDQAKLSEKQQELLRAADEQKSFLDKALSQKETHLEKKQAVVDRLSADLNKTNALVSKLQADLFANKGKMMLRTDIALQQEKVLEKKCQEIETQNKIIAELGENLKTLKQELSEVTFKLEEANKEIQQKELVIKKNENVINWLNRRLTETSSGNHLLSSSRTVASDSIFVAAQPKGNISNLAKGWPPWLLNSVVGSSSSQGDTTSLSNNTNGMPSSTMSSTPAEVTQEEGRLQKITEKEGLETGGKDSKTDTRSRGLDPKYFQSCIDKDYLVNSHVLKACNANPRVMSKPSSSGRQPPSAYFPKKPIPSNSC